MTYENTSRKLVIVFDRNRSPEVLLNAGAHLSLGLGTLLQSLAKPLSYAAPGLGVTATISEHPIILLEAKSSTQLMNLLVKVRTTDEATYNIFANSMLGSSTDEQRSVTSRLTPEAAGLIGVAIFGPREVVDGLTKKFSVYNAVAAVQRIAAAAIPQSGAPATGVDADLPVTGR